MMRSDMIHKALKATHEMEVSFTNPEGLPRSEAYLKACADVGLELDERTVLGNVLHESPNVISTAHKNRSCGK